MILCLQRYLIVYRRQVLDVLVIVENPSKPSLWTRTTAKSTVVWCKWNAACVRPVCAGPINKSSKTRLWIQCTQRNNIPKACPFSEWCLFLDNNRKLKTNLDLNFRYVYVTLWKTEPNSINVAKAQLRWNMNIHIIIKLKRLEDEVEFPRKECDRFKHISSNHEHWETGNRSSTSPWKVSMRKTR